MNIDCSKIAVGREAALLDMLDARNAGRICREL